MNAAEFERLELNSWLLCIIGPRSFKADAKAPIEYTLLTPAPVDYSGSRPFLNKPTFLSSGSMTANGTLIFGRAEMSLETP
jgi:hypothetical protein